MSIFKKLSYHTILRRSTLMMVALAATSILAAPRPNILWLSCEDISPHLGCYGDQQATTPQLDRLARQAVLFENAFTTAGVCAPCRSAIITGMYQTTIGTHHMRCKARLPDHIRLFPQYLRQAGYYCSNNSKTDYQLLQTPADTWDESSNTAHWRNRADRDQPFFAVFNFTGCHESGIASDDKYRRVTKDLPPNHRHDAAQLTLPPYYPDTPVVREDWKRNYDLISAMDVWVGQLLDQLEADGLAEETIVFFWSDHGVGLPRGKRWLYDSGTHVPLIVRIPAKFRVVGQGSPGTREDQLVSMIDLGPTVLNLADVNVPSHMQGRAFLGRNLGEPREYVYGARDRMDERYDIIRSVRGPRFRYIRNYEPLKTYYQYMNTPEKGPTMQEIRRLQSSPDLAPAVKLFLAETKPHEELYDLHNDPHEINNLAKSKQFAETLEQMRKAHLRWVVQTKDIGLIPEPEIVAREQQVGNRFDILGSNSDPTLMQRIRDTATLIADDSESLSALRNAFADNDAAVRYWAAIGLGNRIKQRDQPLLETGLRDASASVRIACARGLCRLSHGESTRLAIEVLQRELASPHQWVRLNAAIVFDEIGEMARPAIPTLRTALRDRDNKYVVRVVNHTLNKLLETNHKVR